MGKQKIYILTDYENTFSNSAHIISGANKGIKVYPKNSSLICQMISYADGVAGCTQREESDILSILEMPGIDQNLIKDTQTIEALNNELETECIKHGVKFLGTSTTYDRKGFASGFQELIQDERNKTTGNTHANKFLEHLLVPHESFNKNTQILTFIDRISQEQEDDDKIVILFLDDNKTVHEYIKKLYIPEQFNNKIQFISIMYNFAKSEDEGNIQEIFGINFLGIDKNSTMQILIKNIAFFQQQAPLPIGKSHIIPINKIDFSYSLQEFENSIKEKCNKQHPQQSVVTIKDLLLRMTFNPMYKKFHQKASTISDIDRWINILASKLYETLINENKTFSSHFSSLTKSKEILQYDQNIGILIDDLNNLSKPQTPKMLTNFPSELKKILR